MSDDAYVNTARARMCVCVRVRVSEYLQHMIAMLDVAPLAGFEIRLQLAPLWKLRNVTSTNQARQCLSLSLSLALPIPF